MPGDVVKPGIPTFRSHGLTPFRAWSRRRERLSNLSNEAVSIGGDPAMAEDFYLRDRRRNDGQSGGQVFSGLEWVGVQRHFADGERNQRNVEALAVCGKFLVWLPSQEVDVCQALKRGRVHRRHLPD